MTAPDRGDIHFAHTFEAGAQVRGLFATSRGRYVVSALHGACGLPVNLGDNEEAQVLLTIADDGTCTLSVTWQGNQEGADWPKHGEGVLITNNNAGTETPGIEGAAPAATPDGQRLVDRLFTTMAEPCGSIGGCAAYATIGFAPPGADIEA